MMTCKEVGPLIDQEEFEKLSLRKRFGMKFHLMMCKLCTGYKKDSKQISQIAKMGKAEDRQLSPEEKQQIKTALNS